MARRREPPTSAREGNFSIVRLAKRFARRAGFRRIRNRVFARLIKLAGYG